MKNNKAFTLIELLAVVTILTILALVITPMIDSNIKKSKEKAYIAQIENIRMAAEAYFSDNISLRPVPGHLKTLSLQTLKDEGYLPNSIKNPKTGTEFNDIYIKLKNVNGKYEYLVCPIEECN